MSRLNRILLMTALIAISSVGVAQTGKMNKETKITKAKEIAKKTGKAKKPERGWWFYDDPIAPISSVEADLPEIVTSSSEKINDPISSLDAFEKRCEDPKTWVATCGFVVPQTYSFEQQQYHALLERFSMQAGDLEAVHQFQQFNHWAVGQAVTAAYTWQYNNVQHPELDSSVFNPYSRFGNLFLSSLKQTEEDAFFHLLSESAFLVYFSRSDCAACQREAPIVQRFASNTQIPIWEASLDDQVLPGFKQSMRAPETLAPAESLKVGWVPALFLYLKPNGLGQSAKWIRLSTGLVSEATLKNRTVNFVQAYRHAMVKGVEAQSDSTEKEAAKNEPNFSEFNAQRLAVGVEAAL